MKNGSWFWYVAVFAVGCGVGVKYIAPNMSKLPELPAMPSFSSSPAKTIDPVTRKVGTVIPRQITQPR